jgi:hypothetical protein
MVTKPNRSVKVKCRSALELYKSRRFCAGPSALKKLSGMVQPWSLTDASKRLRQDLTLVKFASRLYSST